MHPPGLGPPCPVLSPGGGEISRPKSLLVVSRKGRKPQNAGPGTPAPGEAGSTGAGLAAAEKAVISGLIISKALCVRGGEG